MKVSYFAYGSNMDKQRMLDRGVTIYGEYAAALNGWELCFNKKASGPVEGKGYANIVPQTDGIVEGILYQTDEEGIKSLDGYEGYPKDYSRVMLEVATLPEGTTHEAVVYVANPKQLQDSLYPTEEYLGHLLAGARFLTPEYINFLASVPTLESVAREKQVRGGRS